MDVDELVDDCSDRAPKVRHPADEIGRVTPRSGERCGSIDDRRRRDVCACEGTCRYSHAARQIIAMTSGERFKRGSPWKGSLPKRSCARIP
jgi:hypothetical protein